MATSATRPILPALFQDEELHLFGGRVQKVRGQIAVAIVIARPVGRPLAQRQRHVCALQQGPSAVRRPVRHVQRQRRPAYADAAEITRCGRGRHRGDRPLRQ